MNSRVPGGRSPAPLPRLGNNGGVPSHQRSKGLALLWRDWENWERWEGKLLWTTIQTWNLSPDRPWMALICCSFIINIQSWYSLLITYQLQQLQPHFTFGYCKHSKTIQSMRSLFSTTQLQPAQLSLVRCTSRTGAARRWSTWRARVRFGNFWASWIQELVGKLTGKA